MVTVVFGAGVVGIRGGGRWCRVGWCVCFGCVVVAFAYWWWVDVWMVVVVSGVGRVGGWVGWVGMRWGGVGWLPRA